VDGRFSAFASSSALSTDAVDALATRGFVVLPGPYLADELARVQTAYDLACSTAEAADVGAGRTSIRVTDFVNRGAEFDAIYTWPPALDAAARVVRRPFRLSAMHARTLRPGASAQHLHVDVPRTSDAWPMLGVIFMVDEFRADNGATRFVPGSQREAESPEDMLDDPVASHDDEVLACGPAGSFLLFDASTWHGHTANTSSFGRRSLQATFIPRSGRPATDFVARMQPQTLSRLSMTARYLIGVDE